MVHLANALEVDSLELFGIIMHPVQQHQVVASVSDWQKCGRSTLKPN